MTAYAKKRQRQNQQIRIHQALLHGVAQQYTAHEWRDTQMDILLSVIDGDLKDNDLEEIHLVLQAARKLVLHAWAGNETHTTVKNTLYMAAAVLDIAIDKDVERRAVTATNESPYDNDHSPPPKDMDDMPF